METDYYAVLQVDRSATPDEIRRAFRRLILERHPDRNLDDPHASEATILIYEAYTTLSHPTRRAEYDAAINSSETPPNETAARRRSRRRAYPVPRTAPPEPEAIRCQRCRRCDETLRHSEFYMVVGLISFVKHSIEQPGVYCSVCRSLIGAKWLFLSTLCGIWSPLAIFWVMRAVTRNLGGGLRWGHRQRALLAQLAARLLWLEQYPEANRVIRNLCRFDPQNPKLPAMMAQVATGLAKSRPALNPAYYLRRLPAPALCLPVALFPAACGIGIAAAVVRGQPEKTNVPTLAIQAVPSEPSERPSLLSDAPLFVPESKRGIDASPASSPGPPVDDAHPASVLNLTKEWAPPLIVGHPTQSSSTPPSPDAHPTEPAHPLGTSTE